MASKGTFSHRWSSKDKSPLLEVTQGLRVKYVGTGDSDKDAATVRADAPIPRNCGLFYFEIQVLNKGRDGYIGIGLCGAGTSVSRLPGWERNSYGYHGDDGHSFCCTGSGKPYGPTFTKDDVIGCGVNFMDGTCFYTKNGVNLGTAFRDIGKSESGGEIIELYPSVGLRTPDEEVEANFGGSPFKFDIEGFREEICQKARKEVESATSSSTDWVSSQQALNNLVLSYLVHHGYSETAKVLARDTQMEVQEPEDSISNRRNISAMILEGKIQEALALVQTLYQDLFDKEQGILFELHCQVFVEEIARQTTPGYTQTDTDLEWVINYGNELSVECDKIRNTEWEPSESLQEVFSLLAYPDPRKGPTAYLLDPSRRDAVAGKLNSAILGHLGHPSQPPLERVIQHTAVALKELCCHENGVAPFLDIGHYV